MSKFKPSQSSPVRPKRANLLLNKRENAEVQGPDQGSAGTGTAAEIDEEPSPNTFQRFGFITTLVFIFLRFSFAHEFIAAKLHFDTHLVILLGGASYLCCILSGHALSAFGQKATWMWCGFLVFMSVATLTSFWKGGSFPIWFEYLETAFPVIFVIPAVTTTRSQFKKMLGAIGLACVTTIVLGMFNTELKSGRMNIDAAGSDIQDPNDYAAHLILMLPALAYLALRPGRQVMFKLAGLAVFAVSFRQILSTGSRGGLLSLGLTAIYIALIGSNRVKMAILMGGPILMLLALPFVPSESTARLALLFSSSAPTANTEEAVDSKQARIALLEESGKATMRHPLFGVGPGIFMDYQADSAKEVGQKGMWHVTHNSYTEISSECGIPAFLLYVGALGSSFLMLRSVAKSKDRELATVAVFVSVMMVGFCICMFFLSLAYNVQILALSALAVALKQRADSESSLAGSGRVSLETKEPAFA